MTCVWGLQPRSSCDHVAWRMMEVSGILLTGVMSTLKWRRDQAMSGLRKLRNRLLFPVTDDNIQRCLDQLIRSHCAIVMLHSSLSQCGFLRGGAASILDALRARCDTLCLPTHTYCYPTPNGAVPVYDPCRTKAVVGAVTNVFWKNVPTARRSIHPTHSLAAVGALTADLTAHHENCETPCGKGTPYERLIELNASVLMFGATMNAYTLFHTAEDAAECPYLYESQQYSLRAMNYGGQVLSVPTWRQDMSVRRRFAEMDRVLEAGGMLRRMRLGKGEVLFVPSSKDVHAFLMDQLRRDQRYLVAAR